MAIIAFIAAIIAGFAAMIIPPTGVIDASVLWFVAQLLVFTSTLLGLSMQIDSLKQTATNIVKDTKENDNLN